MPLRRIRVFERGELKVGDRGFEERDLALLARFEEERALGAFEIGWRKVMFREQVGVFASGDLVLEILPKAEPANLREDAPLAAKWSRALRRMLEVAYDLPLEAAGSDSLSVEEDSLLDVFAQHFLNLVDDLVRGGLVKGYHRVRERIAGAKGKIIRGSVGIEALIHQERLLCEYEIFDKDILHNRLLAQAVSTLRFLPLAPATIERARKISEILPTFELLRVSPVTFENLRWDRRTTAYRPAIELARLILLGYSPEQREGQVPALALLFAMNDLFEAYIGTLVARAARSRRWTARLQSSRLFWEGRSVRPDIVLEGTGRRVILDTKWKVLSTPTPSMDDLRQMYVYDRLFEADHAYLVYPEVHGFGQRAGRFRDPEQKLSCGLIFLELFDGEQLSAKLGEDLLERVGIE